MSGYREIEKHEPDELEEADVVVYEDDVYKMIDDIESRVSEILHEIEDVQGLELIDTVKEMLKNLSNDLY